MRAEDLSGRLDSCLEQLALPGVSLRRGKVRDSLDLGSELLICTTDRISAFDRVLTTIPCKGEVLNTISLHWFRTTQDIVPNHVQEEVSARTIRALKCEVLPVEVVVRGYLTGSAWRDYKRGATVSGIRLPPGMRFNERFPRPLLTPSTKEQAGTHDRPVSRQEILSSGLVPEGVWRQVEEVSLALFQRGTDQAAQRGLILVDTKYEFGLDGDRLVLVDELHTPDSSRYWHAEGYEARFQEGKPQRELDKEYLRQWLMALGWKGDGEPPRIPDEVRLEVARKYVAAWEAITGRSFVPHALGQLEESSHLAVLLPSLS